MNVLGITASFTLMKEQNIFSSKSKWIGHDSAAAIIVGAETIISVEEERFNRIKHTNKAPIESIKYCLKKTNKTMEDIDYVALNFEEDTLNAHLDYDKLLPYNKGARYYVKRVIFIATGYKLSDEKIIFVNHHVAHAESAFALSGFSNSLVFVADGIGDSSAGLIQLRNEYEEELLAEIPTQFSLGAFYSTMMKHIGYDINEEYKVMGLAPYGDINVFKNKFERIVKLLPNGKFIIRNDLLADTGGIFPRREKDGLIEKIHMDYAACLQYYLEQLILHLVNYYRDKTGCEYICFAGGVSHNCSAIGKVLYSNKFKDIFIQPAAHDAGTAMGAALYVSRKVFNCKVKIEKLEDVYWGTDINESDILGNIIKWSDFIEYKHHTEIESFGAELLSKNKIIGWVQGKAEFGPRALGNRSILADPRWPKNKAKINNIIKNRENFRPFAPSVIEEKISDYFEIPNDMTKFSFMNFVVEVKDNLKETLGATTHINNTARVQAVSSRINKRYWKLINEFGNITDTYVVLNTSFNNNAEPIVDTIDDAINCFITNDLDNLIIGNYCLERKEYNRDILLNSKFKLMNHIIVKLNEKSKEEVLELHHNYTSSYGYQIDIRTKAILESCDEKKTLISILSEHKITDIQDINDVIQRFKNLWKKRYIEIIN